MHEVWVGDMQAEFRRDLSLEQRLTRLVLALAMSALSIYAFGSDVLGLARLLIEGSHTLPEVILLYLLFFVMTFIIVLFPIASLAWAYSLFDWGVMLKIDEKGVFYRSKFRETIPWNNIRSYEIESANGDYVITLEVADPERYLKPPARLLGIRLFMSSEERAGRTSFTTRGLDAIAENIRDLFEQHWQESRPQA